MKKAGTLLLMKDLSESIQAKKSKANFLMEMLIYNLIQNEFVKKRKIKKVSFGLKCSLILLLFAFIDFFEIIKPLASLK
jgi:hypothetical protein